jgi:hypothetical protein
MYVIASIRKTKPIKKLNPKGTINAALTFSGFNKIFLIYNMDNPKSG